MDYLSVTQVLGFFTDTSWYTPESKTRGNAVHEFCHDLTAKTISKDEALMTANKNSDGFGYGNFYHSFIKWHEACDPLPLMSEERLVDSSLGLTGKPDFIGVIRNKNGLGLIDFKTSAHVQPQWKFQVAAYVYLATINGFTIDWGATLSINKEGNTAKLDYVFVFDSIDNKYLKTLQKIFFSLMTLMKNQGA